MTGQLFIDPQRCIGCRACVEACSECPGHGGYSMIHLDDVARATSVQTAPTVCMHCEEPACAAVCPADAIQVGSDGVVHTAMTFVKTAVTGRDMAASWDLVAPDMKEGLTKADWTAGQNLPIIHYPALFGRWRLQYSYANEIDLQVALFEHLKQRRPEVFDVTLHPVRDGSRTRWLVSSFLPTPTQGGGAGGSYRSKLFEAPNPPTTTLSARWLLAPLAVFALLPVLLLVLGVRRWRGARLYRAYARQD